MMAVRFPSVEEFLRQEAAASPEAEHVEKLDASSLEGLLDNLRMVLGPHRDDSGVAFPMQTWLITARRQEVVSQRWVWCGTIPRHGGLIDDSDHGRATRPDEVWAAIQPLLPPKPQHPKGGRPWIEDRAVLGGIIYVLRAGVPWRLLPAKELGCGSGVTCWRRLRDWQAAGVWEALHHRPLDWLGDDGQVDWSRAAIDSVSVRARRGGS
jgi:transposase